MTDKIASEIPVTVRENFNTLLAAAKAGRLALLATTENDSGNAAYLVVAVSDAPDDADGVDLVPFARMEEGNPYTRYTPPQGVDVEQVPA